MILDYNNKAHYQLMYDLFDVAGETAKFYTVEYSRTEHSVSKAEQRVISRLRHENIELEPNEIDRLREVMASAFKVDIYLLAGFFTVVSKGKIAQITTSRRTKNKYAISLLIESLCNSEYYLSHRDEYDDLPQA